MIIPAPNDLAKFAQHALPRGAGDLVLQRRGILGVEQLRHLGEPGGGTITEGSDQPISIGACATVFQRFDQRKKGFVRSEILDAMAEEDVDAAFDQSLHDHFDECRLPDPGLAGDENDLPITEHRDVEQIVHRFDHRVPTDPPTGSRWGR
jgi:hypothetical protein